MHSWPLRRAGSWPRHGPSSPGGRIGAAGCPMVAISPHAGGVAFVDTLNCFSISQPHSTSMHRFRHLLANSGRSRPPERPGWPSGRPSAPWWPSARMHSSLSGYCQLQYFVVHRSISINRCHHLRTCWPIQAAAGHRVAPAGHRGASAGPGPMVAISPHAQQPRAVSQRINCIEFVH